MWILYQTCLWENAHIMWSCSSLSSLLWIESAKRNQVSPDLVLVSGCIYNTQRPPKQFFFWNTWLLKYLETFSPVLCIQIKFPPTWRGLSYSYWLPFSCCNALSLSHMNSPLKTWEPTGALTSPDWSSAHIFSQFCGTLQEHWQRLSLPCLLLLCLVDFQLFSACSSVDPANNC